MSKIKQQQIQEKLDSIYKKLNEFNVGVYTPPSMDMTSMPIDSYSTHKSIGDLPKGKKRGSNHLPNENCCEDEDEDEEYFDNQDDDDSSYFDQDDTITEAKEKDDEKDDEISDEQLPDVDQTSKEEPSEEQLPDIDQTSETDDEQLPDTGEDPSEAGAGDAAGEDAALDSMDTDASMGGDAGGDMGMGTDASMGGDMGMGGEEEEEKTSGELGRIFELKKIYSRLTAIESYLADEYSQDLIEIRNYVSSAIELFEIISANINSYKEKIDEIIIMYYKFIKEVYKSVMEYYKEHNNKI